VELRQLAFFETACMLYSPVVPPILVLELTELTIPRQKTLHWPLRQRVSSAIDGGIQTEVCESSEVLGRPALPSPEPSLSVRSETLLRAP
jgi:hypothetical protein